MDCGPVSPGGLPRKQRARKPLQPSLRDKLFGGNGKIMTVFGFLLKEIKITIS
jgi:hypothetical protein